jgi:MYXO-CTERM domain-containing protein
VLAGVETEIELAIDDAEDGPSGLEVEIDLDYDGEADVSSVGATATIRVDAAGESVAKAVVRDSSRRTGQALLRIVASTDSSGEGGATAASSTTTASAAASGSGGGSTSGGDPAEGDDDGCGCRTVGAPAAPGDAWAVGLALALAATRLRRRR